MYKTEYVITNNIKIKNKCYYSLSFGNFNFIFLFLSFIRIFILYFFLLDDSNRYFSYFQDAKNHWHEEDIAVDNVERLRSEKEKEKE